MRPGQFVYHGAPTSLLGDRLVPLFALEALDGAAFREAMAKYVGREKAPYAPIPGLGIRFNDAVHCAPIHPWYIRQARLAEGVQPGPLSSATAGRRFFRIPLMSITVHPVVWYASKTVWINGAPGEDVPDLPPPNEFEPFAPDRYTELTAVPDEYRVRLREVVAAGGRPLMFVKIPHVLVGGPIELEHAEEIDPAEPPDWERTGEA